MPPPLCHPVSAGLSRGGPLILALGVASLLACSSPSGPSLETRYVLESIAGVPLPATFESYQDSEGNVRTLEAVESSLALYSDGTSRQEMTSVRKLNGGVVESLQVTIEGYAEKVGNTLILRFDSGAGYEDRIDYEILDNGRRLAGAYFGRVYRWIREDAAR